LVDDWTTKAAGCGRPRSTHIRERVGANRAISATEKAGTTPAPSTSAPTPTEHGHPRERGVRTSLDHRSMFPISRAPFSVER
jgi:hypothetical protein